MSRGTSCFSQTVIDVNMRERLIYVREAYLECSEEEMLGIKPLGDVLGSQCGSDSFVLRWTDYTSTKVAMVTTSQHCTVGFDTIV